MKNLENSINFHLQRRKLGWVLFRYSEMPLRNVLSYNVNEIGIPYLDNVAEKDDSKWHLTVFSNKTDM